MYTLVINVEVSLFKMAYNSFICPVFLPQTINPNPWNQPPPISAAGKSTSARSAWTATAPTAPKPSSLGPWTGPCSEESSKPKTPDQCPGHDPKTKCPKKATPCWLLTRKDYKSLLGSMAGICGTPRIILGGPTKSTIGRPFPKLFKPWHQKKKQTIYFQLSDMHYLTKMLH